MTMTVQRFELAEGVCFVDDRLIFVDILQGRLYELDPGFESAPTLLLQLNRPLGGPHSAAGATPNSRGLRARRGAEIQLGAAHRGTASGRASRSASHAPSRRTTRVDTVSTITTKENPVTLKRIAAALIAASMTVGLASCGEDGGTGASDSLTIGAVYLDTQGFYGGVRKGVEDGAKEAGKEVKINETNAQGDAGKESSFVNTLVNARVDAVILSAVSAEGSVPAVRSAANADIPVICYNTCVTEEAMQDYVYAYALGDPVEFGSKLGEAAAAYFKAEGIDAPEIGVINCEFVEVCVERREGFEQSLKDAGLHYEIVANQEGTVLDEAIKVGENILTANPDLDAFFGESGGATEGAVKAVQNRKMVGKTVVFGSDMTTAIAQALADNTILKAVVDISGQTMGRTAIKLAIDATEGAERDEVVEPVQIDLYTKTQDGSDWLETHPDGIP